MIIIPILPPSNLIHLICEYIENTEVSIWFPGVNEHLVGLEKEPAKDYLDLLSQYLAYWNIDEEK